MIISDGSFLFRDVLQFDRIAVWLGIQPEMHVHFWLDIYAVGQHFPHIENRRNWGTGQFPIFTSVWHSSVALWLPLKISTKLLTFLTIFSEIKMNRNQNRTRSYQTLTTEVVVFVFFFFSPSPGLSSAITWTALTLAWKTYSQSSAHSP